MGGGCASGVLTLLRGGALKQKARLPGGPVLRSCGEWRPAAPTAVHGSVAALLPFTDGLGSGRPGPPGAGLFPLNTVGGSCIHHRAEAHPAPTWHRRLLQSAPSTGLA